MWAAFVAVHLWIAYCGVVWIHDLVFWDLDLYRQWIWNGAYLGTWPVLDQPWVYPVGALVPLTVVWGLAGDNNTTFAIGWTVLVTAVNLYALISLLRKPDGRLAALWWMAFLAALGPVAVGRLDAFIAPLTMLGLIAVVRRPRVAAALLTVGAWIKVAPGALILAVVMAVKRPWRDAVLPAASVSAAVVAVVGVLGGLPYVTSFLFTQGDRGMQLEAVGASPWLLVGLFSATVTRDFNQEIYTFEVHGPGIGAAVTILDMMFFVAIAVVALLLWQRRVSGPRPLPAAELLTRGSLLVIVTMLVTDKVLSPQYITWLAAPVAVALAWQLPGWRRTAWTVLGIATATQMVFPWLYNDVLGAWPFATLVLVGRNVALVALWAVTVRQVASAPSTETIATDTTPFRGRLEESTRHGDLAPVGEPTA